MKMKEHIIQQIVPGSIAEEMEIEPGDILLEINGHEIEDIFDYQYYCEDYEIIVTIRKPDGEEWELEIEKEEDEDLGIVFENGLMDDYLCNFMIKCITLRNRFTHDYYKRESVEQDIFKCCFNEVIYIDIFLEISETEVHLKSKRIQC